MFTRTRSLLVVASGCSSTPTGKIPDVTGTWTGIGRFGDMDGVAKSSPEKLVIEKQDGALLWGRVEYQNPDGSPVSNVVIGTLTNDGSGITLTEPASVWVGTVTASSMRVTVSWTGEASHGAFEMTLTRE
jgi:hypothetical protein